MEVDSKIACSFIENENFMHSSDDLDQLLIKTFTNEFRSGYIRVKGCLLPEAYTKFADSIENLIIWDDDVWVCSFPKSGTTWTQEMVWCISNNLDFEKSKIDLGDRFPFLEFSAFINGETFIAKFPELKGNKFMADSVKLIENFPRPRFIKTHLPFHLLPRDLREGKTKAKIIYISRNPKDACVSFYHHTQHFAFTGSFEEFCILFLANKVPYGGFWDHIFSYWNERNNEIMKILFLKYEEMKSDLPSVIGKTVEFLGKPELHSEDLKILQNHLSFPIMKNNPAVNQKSTFEFTKKYMKASGVEDFIRQGKVDGWKTAMSSDISNLFNKWTLENLQFSDFK